MSGAWIPYAAIGAIISTVTLCITLFIHIIKYGEERGAMRERVKRLEQEMIEQKDVKDVVHELKGTVNALGVTVEQFQQFMTQLFQGQVPSYWMKKP